MKKQLLQCTCGHKWEHSVSEPLPDDLRTICPICAASDQLTTDASSSTPSPQDSGLIYGEFRMGDVLSGFEILELLNRGGMGVVLLARQLGLNRLVALKMLLPERLQQADALHRFEREVQAAAMLNHPNIVTVFHTDLTGKNPFLAMEYVPGIDLYSLVRLAGPVPVADACEYIRQTCLGLQHAFEQGLVHRDIKPANLMVTPSPLEAVPATGARKPVIKILDMGLARMGQMAQSDDQGISSITQMGMILGTPDYMSPEQAEDARRADIRSDLYSLGGTLFYILTGKTPFPEKGLARKLVRQLSGPMPSLLEHRQDIPHELDQIVQRLLQPEPDNRFQTPMDLFQALEDFQKQEAAGPASAWEARQAAQSRQGKIYVSPPSTDHSSRKILAHRGGVQTLDLSSDGRMLLTGGRDETLGLWEADKLKRIRCLDKDVGPVKQVRLAPGAKWAASCSLRLFEQDMAVQLWELASGREVRRLKGPRDQILSVSIASTGRRVAAGSADGLVYVWALDQPRAAVQRLKGHRDQVNAILYLPGALSLLSGGNGGMLRLWDGNTGAARGVIDVRVGKINALAFGGQSRRIAVAGESLRVRQADGSLTDCLGHEGPVLCVAFSPDGNLLLSGGSDHTVRLWRTEDGTELYFAEEHLGPVTAVAFTADGQTAFSASQDGTLRRWPLPA